MVNANIVQNYPMEIYKRIWIKYNMVTILFFSNFWPTNAQGIGYWIHLQKLKCALCDSYVFEMSSKKMLNK